MSISFRTICSRGLHMMSATCSASREEFINTHKNLIPAMGQVNRFLIDNCYATLELSPHQIALAEKTEGYWLLGLRNVWSTDSRPIGIFQVKQSSNGGWDLKNS